MGESSPLYQVRVLGSFPTQAADAVIALELVEAAVARWRELPRVGAAFDELGPLEIGVDPARFGDDESVLVARRGPVALEPVVHRGLDGVQLASRVVDYATQLRGANERPPLVRVDVVGIGASVYDQLRHKSGLRVQAVNVGEAATDANYARKRDEVWFVLRDWLRAGGAIPPDPKLESDLCTPTYSFTPAGKIQVESKDAIRERLKRSPDRADALALAVYTPKRAWIATYRAAMQRLADPDVHRTVLAFAHTLDSAVNPSAPPSVTLTGAPTKARILSRDPRKGGFVT